MRCFKYIYLQKTFNHHFISPVNFHEFQMNFKIRHLKLFEMISFEKIFKTVAQKFAIRCK